MKNTEIIQVAALIILAAALLYRKYGKKKKPAQTDVNKMPGISIFPSHQEDEDYQPYAKKKSKE